MLGLAQLKVESLVKVPWFLIRLSSFGSRNLSYKQQAQRGGLKFKGTILSDERKAVHFDGLVWSLGFPPPPSYIHMCADL